MKKLYLLIPFTLTACAGGDLAPRSEDIEAKKFLKPTDGTANVYIYRDENFGAAISMEVHIDNQYIASTGADTYIFKNLPAGLHRVDGYSPENHSWLEVNLLPNTNTFIWQEVKSGNYRARNSLKVVSERIGKLGVEDSSLLLY